jgi:serine protease Do
MEKHALRFLLILSIIAAPLAGGAFILAYEPARHFFNFAPKYDGYVPPRDIGSIVERTQDSTVSVQCRPGKKSGLEGGLGSGWAIDLPSSQTRFKPGYHTAIVTNHHVIEDCIYRPGAKLEVTKYFGKSFEAYLMRFDPKNDLALIGTKAKIPHLELSEWEPYPGYWALAVGTADGYEGSVSIGSVLNRLNWELLITNNVSSGNSGGPLVDNEGAVIGIITWSSTKEQYNGAKSLDAMCRKIIECDGKFYWER